MDQHRRVQLSLCTQQPSLSQEQLHAGTAARANTHACLLLLMKEHRECFERTGSEAGEPRVREFTLRDKERRREHGIQRAVYRLSRERMHCNSHHEVPGLYVTLMIRQECSPGNEGAEHLIILIGPRFRLIASILGSTEGACVLHPGQLRSRKQKSSCRRKPKETKLSAYMAGVTLRTRHWRLWQRAH